MNNVTKFVVPEMTGAGVVYVGEAPRGGRAGRWHYLLLLGLLLPAFCVSASTGSEILRSKAQLAYASKDYSDALKWLDQALQADGSDTLARYYRGRTYARLHQYAQAVVDLQAVRASGADYPELSFELGVITFQMKDYEAAAHSLQRALEQEPQRHEAAFYLGVTLHRMQRYENALTPLQQAEQRGGGMAQAALYLQAESLYHLGRGDEGRAVLHRLIDTENSNRIFDYHLYPFSPVWRGNRAEETRYRALFSIGGMDLQTAAQLLNALVVADPEHSYARYYRGVVASRQGNFDGAYADLHAARKMGMAHREMQSELGYIAYRQGDYHEAEQQLRQGLQQQPEDRRSHFYLGRVLVKQGEHERALQQLQLAGDEGELGAAAIYHRAEILSELHRYAEARQLLKKIEGEHTQSSYAQRARTLDQRLALRGMLLKGLEAEFSAGLVHDSNVALYSNDLPLPTTLSERSDNRWQLGMDLKWKPSVASSLPLTLGYRLFQSRHHTLSDYDLRNHVLSVSWKQQKEDLEWGVAYQYLKASLNNYDYLNGHTLTPHLMLSHSDERLSFFKLQWRHEQYDYPDLAGYDGPRYQLSYRHFWLLGDKRYLSSGVEGGRDITEDNNLASQKYGINAAAQWDWQNMVSTFNLSYLHRTFPDIQAERTDKILKAGVRLRYPLGVHSQLEATINSIDNNSDLPQYDYDRMVYGMTLKWKL